MNNPYFRKRNNCPACGKNDFTNIYSISYNNLIIEKYLKDFYNPQGGVEYEYLKDLNYVLLECTNCNLIFQEYIPNDFLMTKLYEQWINPNFALSETNNFNLMYYLKHATEIINIVSYLDTIPNKLNFLDFGMGWGKWCLLAKAFGCNSYGTELSPTRINYASKHAIQIITWDEISKIKFNFINAEQVFEHIPNPLETVKYLASSLTKNGLIKISVPNGNNASEALGIMDWTIPKGSLNSLNIVAPLEHINCFRSETIIQMAGKCGLEQVKIPFKYQIGEVNHNYKPSVKELVKNILRPYYYKFTKKSKKEEIKSTYLFFKNTNIF